MLFDLMRVVDGQAEVERMAWVLDSEPKRLKSRDRRNETAWILRPFSLGFHST
jgi:hypothetical protein